MLTFKRYGDELFASINVLLTYRKLVSTEAKIISSILVIQLNLSERVHLVISNEA